MTHINVASTSFFCTLSGFCLLKFNKIKKKQNSEKQSRTTNKSIFINDKFSFMGEWVFCKLMIRHVCHNGIISMFLHKLDSSILHWFNDDPNIFVMEKVWCRIRSERFLLIIIHEWHNTMRNEQKKKKSFDHKSLIVSVQLIKMITKVCQTDVWATYLPRQNGEYVIVRKTHKNLSILKINERSLAP